MKWIIYAGLVLIVSFVALRLSVSWLEPRMTFHPLRAMVTNPSHLGIEYQEHRIETSDGEQIITWYLPRTDARAEILFFHGNAGNLSVWLDYLAQLYTHGYSVFALDYRGYGASTGRPTEAGILEDSKAFVDFYWKHLMRAELPVVYFGRSLGGVTSAYASTVREPAGLILEATFPDKATLLEHYPVLRFLNHFAKYRLATVEFLQDIDCPILLIHGDQDTVVPLSVGERLFDLIKGDRDFYVVRGADHNSQHIAGGEEYWTRIENFINRLNHGQHPD
ncbi:MAG TPA: alpha/beta hydrolase [Acidobacteriota bacterium]|nr:alpha/beta hydrolase [Acidobacteriota bacterium]